MSELSDYQRMVEKPYLAKKEAQIKLGNYIFYYLDKREGVIYLVFVRSRDSLASLLKGAL